MTMNSSLYKRYFLERGIFQLLFKGNKVRCNVCVSSFRSFLPATISQSKSFVCSSCGSDDALRALWFYIKNEILGKKNKNKFLWFSPTSQIRKTLKRLDIDVSIPDAHYLPKLDNGGDKLQGGYFDVIVFSHELQYFEEDETILAELRRLLRTGGVVLIQTIVNPEMDRSYEQISTDDDRDRLRKYYEKGMRTMYGANFGKHLARAGFEVEAINYAERLGEGAITYYKLAQSYRNTIYKCKKP